MVIDLGKTDLEYVIQTLKCPNCKHYYARLTSDLEYLDEVIETRRFKLFCPHCSQDTLSVVLKKEMYTEYR